MLPFKLLVKKTPEVPKMTHTITISLLTNQRYRSIAEETYPLAAEYREIKLELYLDLSL